MRSIPERLMAAALLAALAGIAHSQDPPSEETIQYFQTNCTSCHTIGGGRLAGPDLKGAHERKDRDWMIRFMLDPKAVVDSGDPYARKILEESRGVLMPAVPGLSRAMAGKLLDLIAAESALPKSRFAGLVLDDRPLTAADVERGRRLFTGREEFQSGAPSCISCHSVRDLSGLGGGLLGPDLTSAHARLEGRKALAAWLSAPPSVVMRPVYAKAPIDPEEILPIVAFLQNQAESGDAPLSRPPSVEFVLLGLGGAGALFVLMDFAWRRRYGSVRRNLLSKRQRP